MTEEVTFPQVISLDADSIHIHQTLDLWEWKMNNNQLLIFSPLNLNGILYSFSLPTLEFQYKYGRIGRGPDEFIAANWTNTLHKNHVSLYDIPQRKLHIYTTSADTMYQIQEYEIGKWTGEICKPYTNIQEINDSIYLFKADMKKNSILEVMDIKNNRLLFTTSPFLKHDPKLNPFLFSYVISYNHNTLILAYKYMNRIEFYHVSPDYTLTPKLVIGNDQDQHKIFYESQQNFNKLIPYYHTICCTDKYIFVLNQSMTKQAPFHSVIDQYTYTGEPVMRFILDQYINNITIDELNHKIYAYNSLKESNYIYFYSY